jgi:hypothetical protein
MALVIVLYMSPAPSLATIETEIPVFSSRIGLRASLTFVTLSSSEAGKSFLISTVTLSS